MSGLMKFKTCHDFEYKIKFYTIIITIAKLISRMSIRYVFIYNWFVFAFVACI
jgi:hypothetical protein